MSTYNFNKHTFISDLSDTSLAPHAEALATSVEQMGHALKHGHLPQWEAAVQSLPPTKACPFSIHNGAIRIDIQETDVGASNIEQSLRGLMPWRKGPFQFGSVSIDTEWRSDWKWERIASHLSDLEGRTVLDVGCGNGYHLWRMRKAGAALSLGIEPSLLYIKQFDAAQHFLQDRRVQMLPLTLEALPAPMNSFDTVFSMGVLYHRRDPQEHLAQLKQAMTPDGELVLETLVIPGEDSSTLEIESRYANMRNVYQLPSVKRLCEWLTSGGFEQQRVVDVTTTSTDEQRSTDWMTSHSLAQALDPEDASKTVEGHPRPLRATVICRQA